MNLTETRKGEWAILSKAVLAGFFPIITIFSLSFLPTFSALALSTFFTMVLMAGIVTARQKWRPLFSKQILKQAALLAIIIVPGYYGLYFSGVKLTSAGNASLIGLSDIFFSWILFNLLMREHLPKTYIAGAFLTVVAAAVVLIPKTHNFNNGDLLILAAMLCAPVGNYFQRKIRKQISSEALIFLRSLLGLPFLILLALLYKEHFSLQGLLKSLPFLLINGCLILGFGNWLWNEAVHRLPVTKVTALHSINPFFTLIFAYFLLRQTPTIWQMVALVPLALGIILLTKNLKNQGQMV